MTLLPAPALTQPQGEPVKQSPELVPCYLCGTPTMPHRFAVANDPPFAICPLAENLACLARAEDREAAQRATRATAAGNGQDGAPAQAPARRARPRPSSARKTLLGQRPARGKPRAQAT